MWQQANRNHHFCHQEELQKSPTAHEETHVARERQCHNSVEVTRWTGGRAHLQLRLKPELHQTCGLSHESATPSTVLREHYRCSLTMSGMNWICVETQRYIKIVSVLLKHQPDQKVSATGDGAVSEGPLPKTAHSQQML